MTFSRICLGKVDDASNWDGARCRKMKFGGMERLITSALNMLGCAFVISKWCCWAGSWMYRSKIEEKSGDINVGVLGPSRSCGLGWHHLREKHNLRSGALLGTKLWGTPTLRGIERAGREGTPENCIKEEGPERQDGNQKRMVLKKPREEGVLERRAWIALAKLLKISSKRRTTILKTHKRIDLGYWEYGVWKARRSRWGVVLGNLGCQTEKELVGCMSGQI